MTRRDFRRTPTLTPPGCIHHSQAGYAYFVQLVETALGGILFVDEAYALVSDDRDTFGKEALDTLMKGTEDHRDDLVVILAGYPGDMNTLLSRNPGLKSRVSVVSDFPDFDAAAAAELDKINDARMMKGEPFLRLHYGKYSDDKDNLQTLLVMSKSDFS